METSARKRGTERLREKLTHHWYDDIKERDGYECQECGSKENLRSHHIFQRAYYSGLENNINNGITVCHNCHMRLHHPNNINWKVNKFKSHKMGVYYYEKYFSNKRLMKLLIKELNDSFFQTSLFLEFIKERDWNKFNSWTNDQWNVWAKNSIADIPHHFWMMRLPLYDIFDGWCDVCDNNENHCECYQ